jgi:hypothetical protein
VGPLAADLHKSSTITREAAVLFCGSSPRSGEGPPSTKTCHIDPSEMMVDHVVERNGRIQCKLSIGKQEIGWRFDAMAAGSAYRECSEDATGLGIQTIYGHVASAKSSNAKMQEEGFGGPGNRFPIGHSTSVGRSIACAPSPNGREGPVVPTICNDWARGSSRNGQRRSRGSGCHGYSASVASPTDATTAPDALRGSAPSSPSPSVARARGGATAVDDLAGAGPYGPSPSVARARGGATAVDDLAGAGPYGPSPSVARARGGATAVDDLAGAGPYGPSPSTAR